MSRVIAPDRDGKWALTANRWYRLGQCLGDFEVERAKDFVQQNAAGIFDSTLTGSTAINDPARVDRFPVEYVA